MIHTLKGFAVVNKPEVDAFLELFCYFCDPANVGKLISRSSAFSKPAGTSEFHSSHTVEAWFGEF